MSQAGTGWPGWGPGPALGSLPRRPPRSPKCARPATKVVRIQALIELTKSHFQQRSNLAGLPGPFPNPEVKQPRARIVRSYESRPEVLVTLFSFFLLSFYLPRVI